MAAAGGLLSIPEAVAEEGAEAVEIDITQARYRS